MNQFISQDEGVRVYIYKNDVNTDTASIVGSFSVGQIFGIGPDISYGYNLVSLGFDNNNRLYGNVILSIYDEASDSFIGSDAVVEINPINAQILRNVENSGANFSDITFDRTTNTGYAIDSVEDALYVFDPNTLEFSFIASLSGYSGFAGDFFVNGLAFVPNNSVPEPGSIILLGVGVAAAGLASRRRRCA